MAISAVGGIVYLAVKHIFSDDNNDGALETEGNKREVDPEKEHQ